MKFFKTPAFFQYLFPSVLFKIKTNQKLIYLTFDDGPMAIYTDFVLTELAKYNAKATFFLIGENIVQNRDLVTQLLNQGHTLGNHTFNHFNAFKINHQSFLNEVEECQQVLKRYTQSKLFRPPYGKLKVKDFFELKKKYQLVLWDVLVYDFVNDVPAKILLEKAIKNTANGSIVVFHDNEKSFENIKFILPQYLKHFHEKGFRFEAIK